MSAWDGFEGDRTNRKSYGIHSEPGVYHTPYAHQGPPSHAFASGPPAATVPRTPAERRNKEYVHRFVGLGVGLAGVFSEHVLSHPCIVLRRQCQVHNTSVWNHLTPFTLFPTIFNIQRHQSVMTLWKGIGSSLMVKGLLTASEAAIHEFTPLPKEVTRHSSLKKMAEHILLKGLSFAIITPFYAASLVETVQSEIACERPGVFDSIIEGFSRLVSFTSAQPTRLLPIWKLILPTIAYGVLHYVIASLAKYQVLLTLKSERLERKGAQEPERTEETMYEIYYPELAATFSGNLLADTLLYPLETVLHRLYLQGTRTIIDNTDTGLEVVPIITRYDGVVDCYVTIITEEGFAGLYKGFGALILQYGLHMAILKLTRIIFDLVSKERGSKGRAVHFEATARSDAPRDLQHGYRGHERSGEGQRGRERSDDGYRGHSRTQQFS